MPAMIEKAQSPASEPSAPAEPFDFIEVLAQRADAMRRRPKRARTRARLVACAAREIATKGYEGLTIDGICAAAGMARGTFYLYYAHRSEIAVAVFRMFWTLVYRRRPRLRGRSLADRIRVTNVFYLAVYSRNAPFLAMQPSLCRERADFAQWHDQMNHRWSLVIAANMPGDIPRDEKILRARALVAMADDLLSNIFTARTPSLRQWANQPDRLAECLTHLWTRIVAEHERT